MYDNAGKSIKNIVNVITGIPIALCALIGIFVVVMFANDGAVGLGLFIAAIIVGFGCFSAWLSGLVLYAFGDIADRIVCIDEKLSGGVQTTTDNQSAAIDWDKEPQWRCYSCGTSNPTKRAYCIKCNTSREWSLEKQKSAK